MKIWISRTFERLAEKIKITENSNLLHFCAFAFVPFWIQFSTIRFFNDLFNGKKKCWTTRNASQKQPRVCVCVFSTLHFSSFSEISFFVKAKRDILTAWKNGREWRKGKLGLQKTFLHCILHFTMPIKRRTLQQNNRSQKEHLHFDDYNSDDALQK